MTPTIPKVKNKKILENLMVYIGAENIRGIQFSVTSSTALVTLGNQFIERLKYRQPLNFSAHFANILTCITYYP